jgi:hypothetical protein
LFGILLELMSFLARVYFSKKQLQVFLSNDVS